MYLSVYRGVINDYHQHLEATVETTFGKFRWDKVNKGQAQLAEINSLPLRLLCFSRGENKPFNNESYCSTGCYGCVIMR